MILELLAATGVVTLINKASNYAERKWGEPKLLPWQEELMHGDFDTAMEMLKRHNAAQDRADGMVCDCDLCKETWYEASVDYDPCFENSVANLCDCTVEEYYITINGDKTALDVHTYAACPF